MPGKEEFIQIYQEHIHREGAEEPLPPPPATTGPMPEGCATTASTCSAAWRRTWNALG